MAAFEDWFKKLFAQSKLHHVHFKQE